MSEFVKSQQELKANLTEQIRDVIESAEAEKRGLDAAELEKIGRIEADKFTQKQLAAEWAIVREGMK